MTKSDTDSKKYFLSKKNILGSIDNLVRKVIDVYTKKKKSTF